MIGQTERSSNPDTKLLNLSNTAAASSHEPHKTSKNIQALFIEDPF